MGTPQFGVFALRQAVALGVGPRAVQRRMARETLFPVYRAVYSLVPPALLSFRGRYLAAALACGDTAGLAGREAAHLHGLRSSGRQRIDVIVPGTTTRRHRDIDLHRSLRLQPDDIMAVDGIPVTTVARTALDLAGLLRRREVERALDQAEILQVFDGRALRDQLARNPGHPGAPTLAAILDTHYAGSTATWSDLEELCLAATRRARVDPPEVNVLIELGDGEPPIRVDFAWPAQRVIVETDGFSTHKTRQAFEHDRRRDQRLHVNRWRPLRLTWRQLEREPVRIEEVLVSLLATG